MPLASKTAGPGRWLNGPVTTSFSTTRSAGLAFGQSRFARSAAAALRATDRIAPDFAARLALNLFFTPFPTKLSSRRHPPPGWRVERLHTGQEGFCLLRFEASPRDHARPPVLLVHGWAGDALQMRPLGEAVASLGYEPVLMDLPAHGRSEGWRCTMPQIVRALFEAERQVGPFHAVVAHSMGAVASLHALATGLSARRLVALAPSSTPESVLRWFGDTFRLSPGLVRRMRDRIQSHGRMAFEQFEVPWLAERVQTPVLLVHDRGDRMAPVANSEALMGSLRHARFHATQGLSHRRVLADADVIRLAMAHLSAGPATRAS